MAFTPWTPLCFALPGLLHVPRRRTSLLAWLASLSPPCLSGHVGLMSFPFLATQDAFLLFLHHLWSPSWDQLLEAGDQTPFSLRFLRTEDRAFHSQGF